MRLEYQILTAVLLDLIFGDPRWFPHPVKLMGRSAIRVEKYFRAAINNERASGLVAAIFVIGLTAGISFLIIFISSLISPLLGDLVSILILYTCLSGKDLARHGRLVYEALLKQDLDLARERVGWIVGRDTGNLDEAEISRAAVESIAENIVDGITAPLFFGIIGGPIAAITYKAVNTLDSTFGYKNDQYLEFGRASAKIDDLVNYIPARLTAPLIAAASYLLGFEAGKSWAVFRRDGRKHPSPNAGLSEAAVAGALGVELGGINTYFGKEMKKEALGDPLVTLSMKHIKNTVAIMWMTVLLTIALLISLRLGFTFAWR